jgi:hypothetical protein
MGWGVLGNPHPKKKIPLMPFEFFFILHGMARAKLSFKPQKKKFLLKFPPLKCFSLKIHKNSHDYTPRLAMKSKDFKEIT